MAMALRRTSIWLVVLAVALASAWVGFQLATGQSVADIGRNESIDFLGHRDGHKNPPPCGRYGQPPKNPNVQDKNKNCAGSQDPPNS